MPGILPMKVIKVGTNAQSRIAQACDRCRSKKIRCDGVRPCCSQCATVGFECKTSDKLSRRAFPRGYTESLEERVRLLESEVRELKDLLDEKDEKIDMLSRIHSQSSQLIQLPSPRKPSQIDAESPRVDSPMKEELFKVQQSPYLLDEEGSDSYFAGTSSSRTFIEAFKYRVQETGRSTSDIPTNSLLATTYRKSPSSSGTSTPRSPVVYKAPPRLVSDQLINVFFQEWAPLFPILHRPTFLTLYERFTTDFEGVTSKAEIAQLNLVFGIAALSSGTRSSTDLERFEAQWKSAIDCTIIDNSMATLQALILAQLFCVQQGDLTRLQTYKGLSTSLSARLGLHQSQKRFALSTLTCETRKKVFWTLYTVDSFTSVLLGLPKHIKDEDVHCEYPGDVDDEYVTERGFQPTLPGESTKISSALALFRASRILSKVLEEVYPAKTSYDLSLKKLGELSDELSAWSNSLAPHLRLQFAQDKPSTGTISSRSPLLSLTYHYIRALIYRPAVYASLDGASAHSSAMTMATSCKHIIQITQLLVERGMSFSFCLNRDEVLVLAGFGLLFQGLGLESSSKILKDNSKMITTTIAALRKSNAPCAQEFERVSRSFLPPYESTQSAAPSIAPKPKTKTPSLSRQNSDESSATQPSTDNVSLTSSTKKQIKAIASRFTSSNTSNSKPSKQDTTNTIDRRATVHNASLHPSTALLSPCFGYDPSSTSRSEPARSPVNMYSRSPPTATRPSAPPPQTTAPAVQPPPPALSQQGPKQHPRPRPMNLDYLSFSGNGGDSTAQEQLHTKPIQTEPGPTDWERLLGSLDNGDTNIYDACYGGPPIDALLDVAPPPPPPPVSMSVSAAWQAADLWALCQTESGKSYASSTETGVGVVDEWGVGSRGVDAVGTRSEFRGFVLPAGVDDGEGWEGEGIGEYLI